MQFGQILSAILSLAFVLGLLMLTLWSVKYCQLKGVKNRFMQKLNSSSKIEIVETRRIDIKNSVALIRFDDNEHLVLLGANQNIVLEQRKTKGKK